MDTSITLSGDTKLPVVGFGTYLIADNDAQSAVTRALHHGYEHIDTAEVYANETGVGLAIESALTTGVITREALFVTTKLWPGNAAWDQEPKTFKTTIGALEQSLRRLRLDYVDLYLIHAPFEQAQRLEQWAALVELKKQGKTRAIGVSNFGEAHVDEIRDAGLALPQANQIELHPWSQKSELIWFLRANDIATIAYSSLLPLSTWRPQPDNLGAKTKAMIAEGNNATSPFRLLAEKYAVTEAQVLLRWAVQKGYAVLPKSENDERIRANIDLFSFNIDTKDMALMETLDRGPGLAWGAGDPTQFA